MATEAAPRLSFPTDPAEFDSDHRISFSRLDNKFVAVQDDGTEFEFDSQLKRWIPILDEELLEQQRLAYGGGDDHSDTEVSRPDKKRKRAAANSERAPKKPKQNTAVYVTGLPLDATVDEECGTDGPGDVAELLRGGRDGVGGLDAGQAGGSAAAVAKRLLRRNAVVDEAVEDLELLADGLVDADDFLGVVIDVARVEVVGVLVLDVVGVGQGDWRERERWRWRGGDGD